jgi:hypothetical protein
MGAACASSSAQASPAGTPQSWAQAAADCEIHIIQDAQFPVRFREHRIDAKGDTTRVIIETTEGSVARLIRRNGKPLTANENQAERARLMHLLDVPEDFLRHHRHDASARQDAISLTRLMPAAMIFNYAPGQPQVATTVTPQIVLDFRPDPHFEPPTLISQLLTGLAGRLWVDPKTHCLTRVEGHVVRGVNVGWGVIARVYPGGTIALEQSPVAENHWEYSHLEEHVRIRELLVHTAPQEVVATASDFEPLPSAVTFQQAIHMLLDMPISPQ